MLPVALAENAVRNLTISHLLLRAVGVGRLVVTALAVVVLPHPNLLPVALTCRTPQHGGQVVHAQVRRAMPGLKNRPLAKGPSPLPIEAWRARWLAAADAET